MLSLEDPIQNIPQLWNQPFLSREAAWACLCSQKLGLCQICCLSSNVSSVWCLVSWLPSWACLFSCSTLQKNASWDQVFYAFLDGTEVGFFRAVFLVPMTTLGVVHGMCTPMLLAQVAMLLGTSFLGNPACRIGARSFVTLLALVQSFLVRLRIGSFLGTYTLNFLKRQEKQTYVHGVSCLSREGWTDPAMYVDTTKECDLPISLGKRHAHGNCAWLSAWAVVPASSCTMAESSCSTRCTNWQMLTCWGFLSTFVMLYHSCSAALLGNTVRRWNIIQSSNDLCKSPLILS